MNTLLHEWISGCSKTYDLLKNAWMENRKMIQWQLADWDHWMDEWKDTWKSASPNFHGVEHKIRPGNDGGLGRSGNYGDLARSGNRSDLVLAITLKIHCSLVDSVPGRTRSPNKHKNQNDPKTRPRKECQIGVRSGTAPNARSHFLIWNDLAIWIQNETIWPDHFRSAS